MRIDNCLDSYTELYEDTLMSIYYQYFRKDYKSYEKFLIELKKYYNLIDTNMIHVAVGKLYKVAKA